MSKLRILIERDRWVTIGYVSRDGDDIVTTKTATIRRWGTNKGLGQLAKDGPQPKTILDHEGTSRRHYLSVIRQIDCNEEAWKDKL